VTVGLPSGADETLTLGRKVAGQLNADLNWLLLGPMPADAVAVAGQYGVTAVHRIVDEKLESFRPDLYVEALAQYWTACSPRLLLVGQTYNARLVALVLPGGRVRA